MKRNEWYFRSYIEYNHYRKLGGSIFFVTLTYDNEHLPTYKTPNGKVIQCFNKYHIHNFVKYFRILLQRNGYEHKAIKFLICSELGERRKRPHYHGLLYVPWNMPEGVFLKHLRRAWHYGFVGRSDIGWKITAPDCLRYVTKYICKDMDNTLIKKLGDSFRDYAPKHWQSVGFGESFIDDVIMKRSNPAEYLAKNQYSLSFQDLCIPIPRYYHLKVERRINKEYTKVLGRVYTELTDIGKEVKKLQFAQSIVYDMSYLRSFSAATVNDLLPSYSAYCGLFKSVESIDKLTEFEYNRMRNRAIFRLTNLLPRLDYYKVACYRRFLRHYPIYKGVDPLLYLSDIESLYMGTLESSGVPPELAELNGLKEGEKLAFPLCDDIKRLKVQTCSDHYLYRNYERVAIALDVFKLFSDLSRNKIKYDKYKKIKALKDIYQSYVQFKSF